VGYLSWKNQSRNVGSIQLSGEKNYRKLLGWENLQNKGTTLFHSRTKNKALSLAGLCKIEIQLIEIYTKRENQCRIMRTLFAKIKLW
jgi:hypothetical protein